jgi:hypothetical protein
MKLEIKRCAEEGISSFMNHMLEFSEYLKTLDDDTRFAEFERLDAEVQKVITKSKMPHLMYLQKALFELSSREEVFPYTFTGSNDTSVRKKCKIDEDEIREKNLIEIVLEKEGLSSGNINSSDEVFHRFLDHIANYLCYSFDPLIRNWDTTELAEFIYSLSSYYAEGLEDDGLIHVHVLNVIRLVYGGSIEEGDCEIGASYHIPSPVSSGMNYIRLAEVLKEKHGI